MINASTLPRPVAGATVAFAVVALLCIGTLLLYVDHQSLETDGADVCARLARTVGGRLTSTTPEQRRQRVVRQAEHLCRQDEAAFRLLVR